MDIVRGDYVRGDYARLPNIMSPVISIIKYFVSFFNLIMYIYYNFTTYNTYIEIGDKM